MSSRETKKIVKQTNFTDFTTGELICKEEEFIVGTEPDFVKVYVRDIMRLSEINGSNSKILCSLLAEMDYQNKIKLPSESKIQIAEDLSLTVKTIDNALGILVKKGVLFKKGTGLYVGNPIIFGRGAWRDIRQLRMTVVYGSSGTKISTEVEREADIPPKDSSEKSSGVGEVRDEAGEGEMLASVLPVDPLKLMAFLRDPANHTEAIALSSIAIFLSFSVACLNQLFA